MVKRIKYNIDTGMLLGKVSKMLLNKRCKKS